MAWNEFLKNKKILCRVYWLTVEPWGQALAISRYLAKKNLHSQICSLIYSSGSDKCLKHLDSFFLPK